MKFDKLEFSKCKDCSDCKGTEASEFIKDYKCKKYADKKHKDQVLKFYIRILKQNVEKLEALVDGRCKNTDWDSIKWFDDRIIDSARYFNRQMDRVARLLSKGKNDVK